MIAAAAVLASALGIWPGGAEKAPAPQPPLAKASDDTLRGHLLIEDVDKAKHKKKHKAERRHAWMAESTDAQIVVRPPSAAPSATLAPAPAQAVEAKKKKKAPAKTAPAQEEEVTSSSGKPAPAAVATPVPAAADASTGLVRLSVRSVGVSPNDTGNPELLVKLGIENARAADALPDTVTLHLRPNLPSSGPAPDDPSLAFKANVDMVDAPRTTPADPALRMRVRMTIGAAQAATPMVQEPAPVEGGKSNVIALTVPLESFRAPDDDTPPSDDPTTPPDSSGPGGPAPSDPPSGPSDPPSSGPGGPEQPAPADPAPQPDPPPQPQPPAGGDPAPTQPAPTPAPAQQPTEILIPVGPVRPVSGTVPVPVAPVGGDGAQADPIPVDVIVEELPPADPAPADPANEPTTAVQDPPIEVVSTPANSTDAGATPPAAGDPPAGQVPADSPSVSAVSDVGYAAPAAGNS